MKPTSIIFIILAVILIVVGVIVCIVGASIASANEIELVNEYTDKDGNAITKDSLKDYGIVSLNIDIENVDVNIIGGQAEPYIEFFNINPAVYDYTISGSTMTLNTVNPFDITSFVKFRKNGSGFSGLRNYLYLNKYKNKESKINIYISDVLNISEFKIDVENGNISIADMKLNSSYDLICRNGDINITNTSTLLNATVNVDKGDCIVKNSSLKKVDLEINSGNAEFEGDIQYTYYANEITGNVFIDGRNMGTEFQGTYPEQKANVDVPDNEEAVIKIPGEIRASVKDGDLIIITSTNE